MRLALIIHVVGHNDGQARVSYELAKGILAAGHHLTVVAEACAADIAGHERATFVQIAKSQLPTQLLGDVSFSLRVDAWLRRHRAEFDIIQANGFVTSQPVDVVAVHFVHSAWLRNRYFPFHWGTLSPYAWYQRTYTLLNGWFERGALRSARRLIAVSHSTARELGVLGIPADKVVVVPNGVDTQEFQPGASVRLEFGLPERVAMGLFIGDLRTPRKNMDTLLRAAALVPDFHLAVAGTLEGSPYPPMAQELGIGDRVHFLGKTSRVADLMRSVDFFVFPSRYDTFGMVVLEAMASGKAVIVSPNAGAAEYIGDAGIVLLDPEDAALLADAIRRMLEHPEQTRMMGERGRKLALTLNWEHMTERYLAVYAEVLAAKQASGKQPG